MFLIYSSCCPAVVLQVDMELVSGCGFEIGEGLRVVRDVGDTQLYENSLPGVYQLIRELFYDYLARSFALESASKVKRHLYS